MAPWRGAAGARPASRPVPPLWPGAGAARSVDPGGPVLSAEHQGVTQATLPVALKPDPLAARHLRHFGHGEHEQTPVLAVAVDDRDAGARTAFATVLISAALRSCRSKRISVASAWHCRLASSLSALNLAERCRITL